MRNILLKQDLGFWTEILNYQLNSEKHDIKAGFRIADCNNMILKQDLGFRTVILYFTLSNEKYDIKTGSRIPECNIVL
jgi:hypothetical protein